MFLHALANRVPPQSFTQQECWEIARDTTLVKSLPPRSAYLLERLLRNPNGIEKRHFAIPEIERLFSRNAEELNHCFQDAAPILAGDALSDALESAAMNATDLDALVVCTCTGYLCPGVSSYVAEQRRLRRDCYLQDLVGLGCGAAIPALRNAAGICAFKPDFRVGVVAVEICSAAFYVADDPGVLVSLCLFADGASASIWSGQPSTGQPPWRASEFDTVHLPEKRELLRFVNRDGFLRNQLDVSVPIHAAQAVRTLYDQSSQSGKIIAHGGGRDVIDSLRGNLPHHPLRESERVLAAYGNLSSPSVLFALDDHFGSAGEETDLWLTAFGAGFTAHSMRLQLEI